MLERRLTDPSIGFVTVQRVALTPDLSRAIVFVAPLGKAERVQVSLESLQRAAAFVRRELSQRIRMYRIPEIRFQLDPDMVTEESIGQRSLSNEVTENADENSVDADDWQG